jgi:HEAT repeat protein
MTKQEERGQLQFRRYRILVLFFVAALVFLFLRCQEKKMQDERDTRLERLDSLVAAKDWQAVEQAKRIGPSAFSLLDRSSHDADEDIRALSLACLAEVAGEKSLSIFVQALADPVLNVRIKAVLALEKHATKEQGQQLLAYFQKENEAVLQERAILLVGRLLDTNLLPRLVALRGNESDAAIAEKITWSLARLNERESLKSILLDLKSTTTMKRYHAVLGIEYIQNPRLAKELSQVLDDREKVEPDGPAHLGRYRGIRDVAVSVVATITNHKFSFDTSERRKFSETEIDEVRKYLLGL